jgi:hypothetical protein
MADRQLHVELPESSYDRLRLLATRRRQSLRQTLVAMIDTIWDADQDVARWLASFTRGDQEIPP